MTGIVVCGHGHFASGMEEAVNVIAGKPAHVRYVDFELTDSPADLEKKLEAAFADLAGHAGILCLCDLAGGSPFKTCVQLGYARGIESVAGCNLGMLLECIHLAGISDDPKELAQSALHAGKQSVMWFQFQRPE